MLIRKLVLGVAAAGLVLGSAAAAAAPAARAASELEEAEGLAPAVIIGVLATVAIIGGAVVLADSDEEPVSA